MFAPHNYGYAKVASMISQSSPQSLYLLLWKTEIWRIWFFLVKERCLSRLSRINPIYVGEDDREPGRKRRAGRFLF